LRATAVGAARTAEELGKAFPEYRLIDSSGDHVVPEIGSQAVLVVATPGGEPVATGGYAAAALLDADLMLARPELRTAEDTLRRWFQVSALVRPEGRIVVAGNAAHPVVQALIRSDPAGFASRELLERLAAHLPPAWPVAEISGEPTAVTAFLERLTLPAAAELLGPMPVFPPNAPGEQTIRAIVRIPPGGLRPLAAALKSAAAASSAAKVPALYTVSINPINFR
ncbi:MAG: primosome assembly protein PriA, partial [Propionibacteriaceae bacterium]|nr:primosome assembly protein PriA [Propionibacteriaceae bacterium]